MSLLRRSKAKQDLAGDSGTGWVKRGEGERAIAASISSSSMADVYDFPAKPNENKYDFLKARFISDVETRKRMINPFKTLFEHMSFTRDWQDAFNTKLNLGSFKNPLEIFDIFLNACSVDEAVRSPKKDCIRYYLIHAKLERIIWDYFLTRLVAIKRLIDRMTSLSITWDENLKEELYLAKACCNIIYKCLEEEEISIVRLELFARSPFPTSQLKTKLKSLWQELWAQQWTKAEKENPRETPQVLDNIRAKWPTALSI
ncbi:MAG TPA: hypothetical protein VJG90_09200 [Candidatus Nanoarchaeia archaeon]|nr:hypothetical protein [Candidatus Nanoarchaeia archaeon]